MANLLILLVPAIVFSTVAGSLDVLFEWKYVDYLWRSSQHKQSAIDSGNYNSSKVFMIDIDRAPDGRLFVTTPRTSGVPASLSTISDQIDEGSPLLRPYPDWSWYENQDQCRGIISVFRVAIECNKLWVLDTGKSGETYICPAQVLIFDLSTDRLLKRIAIPSNVAANAEGKGLLITPAVEIYGRNCLRNAKIYMADSDGFGLVVWDGKNGELRRYNDTSFNAVPEQATFTIENESFDLSDGIFSLALQPNGHWGHSRRLFYRPLASLKQHFVSTRYLEGDSGATEAPNYRTLDHTFPAQVSAQAFSREGILFMGYTTPPAIACWNSHKEMNDENVVIVAQNADTLQFTSGLKIRGGEMLVCTNRFQKIMAGTQDFSEVNFRILREKNVRNLVRGTSCENYGH